jgi:hypothetical protein
MSLADKKRNVFTTIGSYTSLMEQGKDALQTDLFPSINNKKDIVPFLLDVMKTVAGTDALKETIGGMFTKLVGDIEPQLKTVLKKQFTQSNAGDILPASFVSNGITLPMKDIDVSGKLKIAPTSEEGSLLYEQVKPNFDKTAYNAILNDGNSQTFSVFTMTYNATTDNIQVKPNITTNVSDFFGQYIDDAVIIDEKEITSKIMDSIYGTLAKKQNKTVEQNLEELEISKMLEQVLNDDDSFEISPEDLDTLLEKAHEMAAGLVTYDMGCGLIFAELDFDDLDNMVKSVVGSNDPFFVGNQFENTINQSAIDETTTDENIQTIKDGFFQKIIKIFTIKVLEAVTTAPQIRVMFGMLSSLQNNGVVKLSAATEDMKNFKTCIKCMAKEIMRLVAEFIFTLAVGYLILLLKPVIKRVIKEKINQYSEIIISLTGVIGKFKNVIT